MSQEELQLDLRGPVATIAFCRPAARNALTLAMLEGLAAALAECAARSAVRVVVLRGAGELPFSAGYNLGQLGDAPADAAAARGIHQPIRAAAAAIVACPHPVIGAAQGFVFGAALDLYAHCDLRLATTTTRLAMPPNKFGFLYPRAGMARLVAVAGHAQASRLLLTGEPVSASEAVQWGLVQQTCAAEAFESTLAALAATLAGNAPLSLRATKQVLAGLAEPSAVPGSGSTAAGPQVDEYAAIAACLNSADAHEAMAAFRERRPPVFTGH